MKSRFLFLLSITFLARTLPCLPCLTCLARGAEEQGGQNSQRTFSAPAEATRALIDAATKHDWQALREIFGPEVTNLWTGDTVLDERHLEVFGKDLAERCDPVPRDGGVVMLEIGQKSWPFPIPLVQTNGAWVFDTIAGEEEIINRHVGRNEYYAIGVCRAYVEAQRAYARRFTVGENPPQYAAKFKSSPGRTDGLYWPTSSEAPISPFSYFVAGASLEGYNWSHGAGPRPFHGYIFKILKRQGPDAPGGKMNYVSHGKMTGGFALVAYPIRWGESGVMTFIVSQQGQVYQRSLGPKTTGIAAAMKEYDPDSNWTVVQERGITDFATGSQHRQFP